MSATGIFRKILVPCDFSKISQAALAQALDLARRGGAEVTVLHVVADLREALLEASAAAREDIFFGENTLFQQELRRRRVAELHGLLGKCDTTGVTVHAATMLGTPYVAAIQAARERGFDLIVAGNRGLSGLPRLVLGSTARRLVRKSPVPVWIVREQSRIPVQSIVCGVDFSDASTAALGYALALARAFEARLQVVHVVDLTDAPDDLLEQKPSTAARHTLREEIDASARKRFDTFLGGFNTEGVNVQTSLEWGVPWKVISESVRGLDAALAVLGTVGRGGVPGVLLGNTAEKVLDHVGCGVMAVKPADFRCPVGPIAFETWEGGRANADREA